MVKTYEKSGKTLEGCGGAMLAVGGVLTHVCFCGQWYLTTSFSFLHPPDPK